MVIETQAPVCTHRWLIDPPQGPKSRGHCSRCGVERAFDNTPVVFGRGGEARPLGGDSLRLSARSSHRETIVLSDER